MSPSMITLEAGVEFHSHGSDAVQRQRRLAQRSGGSGPGLDGGPTMIRPASGSSSTTVNVCTSSVQVSSAVTSAGVATTALTATVPALSVTSAWSKRSALV